MFVRVCYLLCHVCDFRFLCYLMFHDCFFSFVHFRMLSSKAEGKLWQFENYPGYFRLYDKLAAEKLGPDGTLYYSVMPNGFAIQ